MRRRGAGGKARVDWADLQEKVEAAGRALSGDASVSPERIAALLQERARALARAPLEQESAVHSRLITVSVGGEVYGIEPGRVMEIRRAGHLSPLPRAEPWMAGLIGWRGELIVVADLLVLLGVSSGSREERRTLVVLGDQRARVGLLVDRPGEMITVAARDLRPAPEGLSGREYLRGLTADAVLVLDVDRVLDAVGPEPD